MVTQVFSFFCKYSMYWYVLIVWLNHSDCQTEDNLQIIWDQDPLKKNSGSQTPLEYAQSKQRFLGSSCRLPCQASSHVKNKMVTEEARPNVSNSTFAFTSPSAYWLLALLALPAKRPQSGTKVECDLWFASRLWDAWQVKFPVLRGISSEVESMSWGIGVRKRSWRRIMIMPCFGMLWEFNWASLGLSQSGLIEDDAA